MFESIKLFDRELFLGLNGSHTAMLDEFMFYVSKIWIFTPLFMYWIYQVLKQYEPKKVMILAFFLILLVTLTDQSSNRVKHAVKRYRPTHNLEIKDKVYVLHDYRGGQYGFFSGHSANCFGIAMLLALIFKKRSVWFRSQFFLWAALTAYSRIYLGVHYPSDILVGLLVGIFFGFVVHALLQFVFKKYYNEQVGV